MSEPTPPKIQRLIEKLSGTMKKYTVRIHFKSGSQREIQCNNDPCLKFSEELRACVVVNHYNDAPFLFRMEEIEGYSSEVNGEAKEL